MKGKSRSKKGLEASTSEAPPKKELSKETRSQRLHEIKEDYKDLNDRIKFKENEFRCMKMSKTTKSAMSYWRQYQLKKQRRLLEAEEKNLMRLNAQSKWYFARKKNDTSTSSSTSASVSTSDFSKSRSTTPIPVSSESGM